MDTAASVNANNARKLASVPQSNHQAQDGIHSPPDRRWDALSSSRCRDEQHGPTVSRRSRIEGQKRHVNIVHMFLCTNVVTGSLKHPSQSGAFPRNGWSAAIKPHMNQAQLHERLAETRARHHTVYSSQPPEAAEGPSPGPEGPKNASTPKEQPFLHTPGRCQLRIRGCCGVRGGHLPRQRRAPHWELPLLFWGFPKVLIV